MEHANLKCTVESGEKYQNTFHCVPYGPPTHYFHAIYAYLRLSCRLRYADFSHRNVAMQHTGISS